MIREQGGYTPNKSGNLEFRFNSGFGTPIVQDASEPNAEAKLLKKVKDEIQSWTNRKRRMAEGIAQQMRLAIENIVF